MENRVEALGRDINDAIWLGEKHAEFQKVMESLMMILIKISMTR